MTKLVSCALVAVRILWSTALVWSCLLTTLASAYVPTSALYLPDVRIQTVPLMASSGILQSDISTTATASLSPKIWKFRGHQCYAEISRPTVAGGMGLDVWSISSRRNRPDVVLIHGFGCSTTYWRETRQALNDAGYTVHALDLLGQGKSAKPGRADNVEYSINLWAQMVEEYTEKFIPRQTRVVLIGNSLGSMVALSAATGDHSGSDEYSVCSLPSRIQGIGMYNCGIGMNSRNLLKDPNLNPFQRIIFTALFDALDNLIFGNIPLLTYVLEDVVSRDLLRNALVGLYQYSSEPQGRVDDVLVESFYLPAKDQGSVEALSQIYTNDAGKTPMELHDDHANFLNKIPLHLVWGTKDNVTPIAGPVGQFYMYLAENPDNKVSLSLVEAGHIPFDEIPESNNFMIEWLDGIVAPQEYDMASKAKPFPWTMGFGKFMQSRSAISNSNN